MTVVRWILEDPLLDETYEMHLNPNEATNFRKSKALEHAVGLQGRVSSKAAPPRPVDWEFGGVIRTEAHHDELIRWQKKPNKLRVTDHVGRTFEIMLRAIEIKDRTPTPTTPWRFTYTMRTMLLRRIS